MYTATLPTRGTAGTRVHAARLAAEERIELRGVGCIKMQRRPARSLGSGLIVGCGRRRCGLERQEVGDADDPQYLSFNRADAATALVVKQARCAEPDGAPSGVQFAAAGGQHVFDPVGVRTVGQGEEVAVLGAEYVHRRLVVTSGAPTAVYDDAEARHPGCDTGGEPVEANLVPPPHPPGNRHGTSFVAAGRPAGRAGG